MSVVKIPPNQAVQGLDNDNEDVTIDITSEAELISFIWIKPYSCCEEDIHHVLFMHHCISVQ